ncbi:MAG: acyl-CoA dehydrogenase family protein [Acidimicrobiales bacterium]
MTAPATPGSVYRNIPDAAGINAFTVDDEFDALLAVYLEPDLLERVRPRFRELGELVGRELERLALSADRNPPVLEVRDRTSRPVDRVVKHPDYVALERYAFGEFGLAAMSHRGGVFGEAEALPPLVKYGLVYLFVQAEFGLCCPLSMTDSLTRTLVRFGHPDLVDRFFDRLTSQDLDELHQGAMFMTEQEAGSDVGAITTVARLGDDGEWRLWGDKWFCSNPDAELAMVLARPEGGDDGTRGLSLFLLPRHRPDGSLNSRRIVRLKDKLGTRSMASGEVTLDGAVAYLVGDPGQGFKQMTDMMNMSRLANGVRSAGMMRRSVNEARFITANRHAFGRPLADLPLMHRQVAKLETAAEEGRAMVFHTAEVLRRADAGDADMGRVLRILTPLIKVRTCRDARKVTGDLMEIRGGVGYIEEWSDARMVRDAHLGSIWEGTSNIVALDVARATRREGALDALTGYLHRLLDEPGVDADLRATLGPLVDRAAGFLAAVAGDRDAEIDVRRAASAVYHATAAVFLAWEDARIATVAPGLAGRRARRAWDVIDHKLTAHDPLAPTGSSGPAPTAGGATPDRLQLRS